MRVLLAIVAAALLALLAPGVAASYGWPIRPFHEPHPIRGTFDDPRLHIDAEGTAAAFHFGVDIAAPDGTPVYAVGAGVVTRHPGSVSLMRPNRREFGFWHIRAVVRSGQHVRLHQLLGYVAPGWGHVHLSESIFGVYLNPLRRGALTPFPDRTVPVVAGIQLDDAAGAAVDPAAAAGRLSILVDSYDLPPLAPPPPWQVARLTPALIRWRVLAGTSVVVPWQIGVDFRSVLYPDPVFDSVYAPGTYQNKANRPGRYLFWLTRAFDTSQLPDGSYVLEVAASDMAGNTGSGSLAFTVANQR